MKDSPLWYWKLDETSGIVAANSGQDNVPGDYTGSPALGVKGAVYEPGSTGVNFDTTSSTSLDISDVAASGDKFSFEVWYHFPQTDTARSYLFDFETPRFLLILNDSSDTDIQLYKTADGLNTLGTTLQDGKPHHLVFTLDGTKVVLYQDGEYEGGMDVIDPIDLSVSPQSRVGNRYNASGSSSSATLQHVAIYNKILTPERVRAHYRAGRAWGMAHEIISRSPNGFWPLNESSGDAIDWSRNENDGVLSGDITVSAPGHQGYSDDTGYTFAGVNGELAIAPPTATTTYSLVAIVVPDSATGEYKILEDNGVGHWSIKDGKQNLNYSAADHLSTTALAAGEVAVLGVSVSIGAVNFYLNGEADGTATSAPALNFETISDALASFDGVLQNVAIFPTWMSAVDQRDLAMSARTLMETRGHHKVVSNLSPTNHWRLGEAEGPIAYDETVAYSNGIINGNPVMATADGPIHQSTLKAMTFDGTDDYVQTASAGVAGSATRTICVLFKPAAVGAVEKFLKYGSEATGTRVALQINADGTFGVDFSGASANGSTVMVAGNFYMLTMVFAGSTVSGTNLYVNDNAETESYTNGSTAVNTGSSVNIQIGADTANSNYAACDMAEVISFSSALTAHQVKQVYAAVNSRFAAEVLSYSPVNYFRFDDASGDAVDLGSLGNDGVWTGTPGYSAVSEYIKNEPANTGMDVVSADSMAFTSAAASTTFSLAVMVTPDSTGGTRELFDNGTDGLRLNGNKLSYYYSSAEHDSDAPLYATKPYLVGVSVNAGVGDLKVNAGKVADLTSVPSFSPTGMFGNGYDGIADEAMVFAVALSTKEWTDIVEMSNYPPAVVTASYSLDGTLEEPYAIVDWVLLAWKFDTGEFISRSVVSGESFSIDIGVFQGPVLLTLSPEMGEIWTPSAPVAIGDKIYPTKPTDVNRFFTCTANGTTSGGEPTWPTSGTVVDGSATWTFVSDFVRPKTHGPLIPSLNG